MLLASCGCLALQQLCRVLCHAIIQQPLVERARRRIRSLLLLPACRGLAAASVS